ncbi:MAG: hypothetical protein QOH81_2503 [Sphingomonadales bacterium]|jgi:hypothetical protein|nr:hypothetical protein [Sphingomonadales bacterium]
MKGDAQREIGAGQAGAGPAVSVMPAWGGGAGEGADMATTAIGYEDRSVSIGRIFSRAFGTIGSNPVATLGIAFLFAALPATVIGYGQLRLQGLGLGVIGIWQRLAISLMAIAVSVALAMITQGALVRATVAHSQGRKANFAESASAGLVVALPLFLLALVSAIGIGIGLILLIVPGIILYIRLSVAAPALVEERLGVLDALSRSNDLTEGARWKIFGIELVALIGYWMFSALVGAVAIVMFGGLQGMVAAMGGGVPISYYVLSAIAKTLTSAVWGVIQTSLYVELRDWKDGPASDTLAEVFG